MEFYLLILLATMVSWYLCGMRNVSILDSSLSLFKGKTCSLGCWVFSPLGLKVCGFFHVGHSFISRHGQRATCRELSCIYVWM